MHSEASGNNIWHPGDREIAVVAIRGAICWLFTTEALRLQEARSNHCLWHGDEQCLRGPQVARSLFKSLSQHGSCPIFKVTPKCCRHSQSMCVAPTLTRCSFYTNAKPSFVLVRCNCCPVIHLSLANLHNLFSYTERGKVANYKPQLVKLHCEAENKDDQMCVWNSWAVFLPVHQKCNRLWPREVSHGSR